MRNLILLVSFLLVSCVTNPESDSGADSGVNVAFDSKDVDFETQDGLTLKGKLFFDSNKSGAAPGVLLLHQYQRDHDQWTVLPEVLVNEGYQVLAFSYRGHGESDAYDKSIAEILSDPEGAPVDVQAALAFFKTQEVDPERIAIVGTSIGANLAVASSIRDWAKTSIAISARRDPSLLLADSADVVIANVFYVASENDSGGQAVDSQIMHDSTNGAKEIKIYSGSAHGIALLEEQRGDLTPRILTWLATNL